SLQIDGRCVAAAHGAAIALAERAPAVGELAAEARRVFQDVRDAAVAGLGPPHVTAPAGDLACRHGALAAAPAPAQPVWPPVMSDVILWAGVNAAHALVDAGSHRQAVLAYEASLRRLRGSTRALLDAAPCALVTGLDPATKPGGGDDAEDDGGDDDRVSASERADRQRAERDIGLYLVRAQYVHAKTAKDLATMRQALAGLRAMAPSVALPLDTAAADPAEQAFSPDDGPVLFDLALVEQAIAQLTSDLPTSQRTLADLAQAATDLAHSTALFTFLAKQNQDRDQEKPKKPQYSRTLAGERATFGNTLAAKLSVKTGEQQKLENQRQEGVDQWRRQLEEEEVQRRMDAETRERERVEMEARILRETDERNAALREQMTMDAAVNAAALAEDGHGKPKRARNKRDHDHQAVVEQDEYGYKRTHRSKPTMQHRHRAHADDDDDGLEMERTPSPAPIKYKSKAIVTDSEDSADDIGDGERNDMMD
ncbi:hypothetical protein LPJ66_011302, partial [Kickxella alabastrina]